VGKSGSDSGTAVVRFEPIGGRDEPASGLEASTQHQCLDARSYIMLMR
jgi:hypothetical protein